MTDPIITPDDLADEAAREPLPEPEPPRPPQGIVIRYLDTGDRRRDFHRKWTHRPVVDPASLVVNGQDPFMALPIDRNAGTFRIKQIKAEHAAAFLTCDDATGQPSVQRLATDDEVAQRLKEDAERAISERAYREKMQARRDGLARADAEHTESLREGIRRIYTPPADGE